MILASEGQHLFLSPLPYCHCVAWNVFFHQVYHLGCRWYMWTWDGNMMMLILKSMSLIPNSCVEMIFCACQKQCRNLDCDAQQCAYELKLIVWICFSKRKCILNQTNINKISSFWVSNISLWCMYEYYGLSGVQFGMYIYWALIKWTDRKYIGSQFICI